MKGGAVGMILLVIGILSAIGGAIALGTFVIAPAINKNNNNTPDTTKAKPDTTKAKPDTTGHSRSGRGTTKAKVEKFSINIDDNSIWPEWGGNKEKYADLILKINEQIIDPVNIDIKKIYPEKTINDSKYIEIKMKNQTTGKTGDHRYFYVKPISGKTISDILTSHGSHEWTFSTNSKPLTKDELDNATWNSILQKKNSEIIYKPNNGVLGSKIIEGEDAKTKLPDRCKHVPFIAPKSYQNKLYWEHRGKSCEGQTGIPYTLTFYLVI